MLYMSERGVSLEWRFSNGQRERLVSAVRLNHAVPTSSRQRKDTLFYSDIRSTREAPSLIGGNLELALGLIGSAVLANLQLSEDTRRVRDLIASLEGECPGAIRTGAGKEF